MEDNVNNEVPLNKADKIIEMINTLTGKLNELYHRQKDSRYIIDEIRTTQKGFMSIAQSNDIATKVIETIEERTSDYFGADNYEFEISESDRVEVYDKDIHIDDESLLHSDISDALQDYYGEPAKSPPSDIPVQFNSVENKDKHTDAKTGALAN